MKAPSSEENNEDGAEENHDELVFDYADFFSVLMYYANMSKGEIMNHSRAFLHCIYRMYAKRACENLGVPSKREGEEDDENDIEAETGGISLPAYELDSSDYPTEFTKLPPKSTGSSPQQTRDFLASFAGAEVFKNVTIAEDD